jgi:hypothetical protein
LAHALCDIHKARHVTQEHVAEWLDGKQVNISRPEKYSGAKLFTLREYVRAIGGGLQLMVMLPNGRS